MTDQHPPPTRWDLASDAQRSYGPAFARKVAAGDDVDGEARLADAMLPRDLGRPARVLDAGSGMGRVGAGLLARGHDVVGVEKDPALIAQGRATYPDLAVVESDLLACTPDLLAGEGHHRAYDLVVLVGNVLVLAAPDTESLLLSRLRDLLEPDGRVLVGFHHDARGVGGREYDPDLLATDAARAGLRVDVVLGSYDVRPHDPAGDYCVAVLSPTR